MERQRCATLVSDMQRKRAIHEIHAMRETRRFSLRPNERQKVQVPNERI